MLPLAHRLAFAVFASVMLAVGVRGLWRVVRRVARGRPDTEPRTDHLAARLWYALRTTLLQNRTFRKRPVVSILHAWIFYAFVVYLLVNLVDAVEGFVDLPSARSPLLHAVYAGLADLLSLLALLGVLALVLRRLVLPARRDFRFNAATLLHERVRAGAIQRDSLLVSAFILLHVGSRVLGNAARLAAEGRDRWQPFSSALAPLFAGPHVLAWRILGYWGALGSVLAFLAYFPYTKHLHLLAAPVKYFLRRPHGSGVLPPAPFDTASAQPEVGAAQLADLAWPRLLDAYACVQCNRCQDVCPASATGKALSPAALEINKRMVLSGIARDPESARAFEQGAATGPALFDTVISAEAVWACTTCGACVQVCPTQDEPMLDIVDIRRNLVMMEGDFPAPLQAAFRGMERNSNPWGLARDKRMAWAEGLDVPTIDDVPEPEVLYWVGCAASYDAGAQKTARAMVHLLHETGVRFAVLGKQECCTGDSARRAGHELLYEQMAKTAIATLQSAKAKTVVSACPHCVNTIGAEYPQFGGEFTVMHHTEYLASALEAGKIVVQGGDAATTFHDPCYLGRHRGTYEEPRSLLRVLNNSYREMPRHGSDSFCCGAGGAQFWKEEEHGTERIAENRMREAQAVLGPGTGDKVLAVGCPFCRSMLGSSPDGAGGIAIKDVAELLWEGVQRAKPQQQEASVAPLDSRHLEAPSQKLVSAAIQETATPANTASLGWTPSQPDGAAVETTSPEMLSLPPSPARKKWAPRAATPPEPVSAVETPTEAKCAQDASTKVPAAMESGTQPQASDPPARRKWQPGKTPTMSAGEPEPTADPAHMPAEPAPAAPEGGRKKWQPKTPKA